MRDTKCKTRSTVVRLWCLKQDLFNEFRLDFIQNKGTR